jgi:hypothetical protein
MKVELTLRHYGVHDPAGEAEIPGEFSDYATPTPGQADDYAIDEDKLIAALPEGFLPDRPSRILLGVTGGAGSAAQGATSRFHRWAKYFDAHMLWLVTPGPEES